MAFAYMLRCADGSFYIGSTSGPLDKRIAEHESGAFPGYTFNRRPVQLVWSESFEQITDAIAAERKIKGWSRAKKLALIEGDWDRVSKVARRRGGAAPAPHPSRLAALAPQDDGAPDSDGACTSG